jgi:hypothetical protein
VTTDEALAELEIERPWGNKLSCPKHSDSDPSLHLYEGDKGWYCFSCNTGGDGWDLLALYYEKPVAEIMRERGHRLGPRPRSRWEQLAALEARAWELRYEFHLAARRALGRSALAQIARVEDVADEIYGTSWLARYFPEEEPPYRMEQVVNDMEKFYAEALHICNGLAEMKEGR